MRRPSKPTPGILAIILQCALLMGVVCGVAAGFYKRRQPLVPPQTAAVPAMPAPENEAPQTSETVDSLPELEPGAVFERSGPMPKGRYTVFVRDAQGRSFEVRIFDPNEKVEIDRHLGSEFKGNGEKYYTGTYQVALRRQGATKYLVQRLPLFGFDTDPRAEAVFTPWNRRVFVLNGTSGRWPELLLVTQYATSNHNHVRAFFVQKGILAPILWRVSGKQKEIGQYVSRSFPVKRVRANLYQTFYWSPEDGYHLLTWRFEPKARQMVLLRDQINPEHY